MKLYESIKTLKGIGKKKDVLYGRLGIRTVKDLIEYYPKSYETGLNTMEIDSLEINQPCQIKGQIQQTPVSLKRGRFIITKTSIRDKTGEIEVIWFNQPYLKNQLKVGEVLFLKGKTSMKNNRLHLSSPRIIGEKEQAYLKEKAIVPIYSLGRGLSQRELRLLIKQAMDLIQDELKEFLPDVLREKYGLVSLREAIFYVHYPENTKQLEVGRQRLIFDEFLMFQLGLLALKEDQLETKNTYMYRKMSEYNYLIDNLPYKLTKAQQRVMIEIIKDLQGQSTMNRLIQGDVGSGKTVVAALAIGLTKENGYQSVLMAPTEVLVKQHYKALIDFYKGTDIQVGLLIGSMTKKNKEAVYEKIKQGSVDVVVGTHAVIQTGVVFKKLALVITDEQHRFGVKQRETLSGKGDIPHVLAMSATPIPRTLALMLYSDMAISVIDEMPPGRQIIKTYCVPPTYRPRMYKFLLEKVQERQQCYVVCPKIEEDAEGLLADVTSYKEALETVLPKEISIGYLHGQMKAQEKNERMSAFVEGKIDILVATTVIEVGVHVPRATVMVIENAERFGLAQLHQLRGRVGRGEAQSYCVLVTESKTGGAKKRMAIMCESSDGFFIAEKDLELRGHGDLLGVRQSGVPLFKLANITEDYTVLKMACEVAKEIRKDEQRILNKIEYK